MNMTNQFDNVVDVNNLDLLDDNFMKPFPDFKKQIVGTAYSRSDEYNEDEKEFRDAVKKTFYPNATKNNYQ